jgi:predicted hotdog family 3-hydroxylacyl-ACP dehydratase
LDPEAAVESWLVIELAAAGVAGLEPDAGVGAALDPEAAVESWLVIELAAAGVAGVF